MGGDAGIDVEIDALSRKEKESRVEYEVEERRGRKVVKLRLPLYSITCRDSNLESTNKPCPYSVHTHYTLPHTEYYYLLHSDQHGIWHLQNSKLKKALLQTDTLL